MGFSIRKLWRGHTESRHPVESTQPPPFGPSPQTSRWKMLGKIRGTLGGLQKTIQARCENGKMGVLQKKVQENCDKLRDFQKKLQKKGYFGYPIVHQNVFTQEKLRERCK